MGCVGMTQNGLTREERYITKTGDAQKRQHELAKSGLWSTEIRRVGSKHTRLGACQCVELIIMGKEGKALEKDDGLKGVRNTSEVPPVEMLDGGMK